MKLKKDDYLKTLLSSEIQYSTQSIYADSLGIDASNLKIQGSFFSKNSQISQTYLANFENSYKYGPINGASDFMSSLQHVMPIIKCEYRESGSGIIKLPKPRKLKVNLQDALFSRTSSRNFSDLFITKQELSDFLFYSAGSFKKEKKSLFEIETERNVFTYPSGGGMYAISLLLMIYNVENITPCGYIYQPISHTLKKVSECISLEEFMITKRYDKIKAKYVDIENLTPSIFICCINDFSQQRFKYGELSLALAYTDCGCLMQNAGLLASAMNFEFCVWAGFKKSNAEKKLNIDGHNRHIIMTALLGKNNEKI